MGTITDVLKYIWLTIIEGSLDQESLFDNNFLLILFTLINLYKVIF